MQDCKVFLTIIDSTGPLKTGAWVFHVSNTSCDFSLIATYSICSLKTHLRFVEDIKCSVLSKGFCEVTIIREFDADNS